MCCQILLRCLTVLMPLGEGAGTAAVGVLSRAEAEVLPLCSSRGGVKEVGGGLVFR